MLILRVRSLCDSDVNENVRSMLHVVVIYSNENPSRYAEPFTGKVQHFPMQTYFIQFPNSDERIAKMYAMLPRSTLRKNVLHRRDGSHLKRKNMVFSFWSKNIQIIISGCIYLSHRERWDDFTRSSATWEHDKSDRDKRKAKKAAKEEKWFFLSFHCMWFTCVGSRYLQISDICWILVNFPSTHFIYSFFRVQSYHVTEAHWNFSISFSSAVKEWTEKIFLKLFHLPLLFNLIWALLCVLVWWCDCFESREIVLLELFLRWPNWFWNIFRLHRLGFLFLVSTSSSLSIVVFMCWPLFYDEISVFFFRAYAESESEGDGTWNGSRVELLPFPPDFLVSISFASSTPFHLLYEGRTA